ncbi:MAG: trehalose/maltose transport system permease protein [Candidatus Atribacteria bacterium]|nr:trehalose/maltose transport system permease protein [Candidatus Atribacteria bacterium]
MMFKKNTGSKLLQREQRLAYLLLLPTFLVLIVVALYPLGLVFVTSFTDRTFASPREPNYVGFNNYAQLLSMTIRELPPLIDEETGLQAVDQKTGEPLYERPLRVLPREPRRYREVSQFSFFGKRYVLGASDPDFIKAVWDTLVFTVISVLLETILGLGIALVVNSPFKGRGVMRAAMLVPWAVITVVSARMWQWMLAPTRVGVINVILQGLGLGDGNIAFLSQPEWQLPALIMVDVWKTTPFMALLLLAGLQLIPNELYEAARVDGAGSFRQFISITMPLLRPTMAVALVFRTLDALRVFDLFQVMLAQSRYSMASYNYYQLIGNRAMGQASAIGVIIFIFIFIFAVAYIRLLGVKTD